MLSLEHILYMLVVVIVIIIFHILIKRKRIDFDNFLKYAAIVSVSLDPIYWIWEYNTFGHLRYESTLPLYICSLFWMLLVIVAFSKKQGAMYRTALSSLVTIVAFGAVLGLVLNAHIGVNNFWHFRVQYSLLYHSVMVTVIALIWSTGYYKVQAIDKKLFFIPMLILMLPAFIVDKVYAYNYCYFNGGEGAVLVFFDKLLGRTLFVITFYTLLFAFAYLILSLAQKFKNK